MPHHVAIPPSPGSVLINDIPTKPADLHVPADKADMGQPDNIFYDDPPEEELVYERGEEETSNGRGAKPPHATPQLPQQNPKPSAYVAPIPHIGPISPIKMESISTPRRPQLPHHIMLCLVGKRIDEFGDVVDENGCTLGRVAGDLPSMVGRTVLNQQGDVRGDDGELLGYVVETFDPDQTEGPSDAVNGAALGSKQSLEDYMRQKKSSFMIDETGNILDSEGNIVGGFHDYKCMGPKPAWKQPTPKNTGNSTDEKKEDRDDSQRRSTNSSKSPENENEKTYKNAQSFRNEEESPSDIFLDVKSTREGIQLTIRIPTVFADGRQLQPKIQFS